MSPKKSPVKCKNILSYFKNSVPTLNTVVCPACERPVPKHFINSHLDNECSSLKESVSKRESLDSVCSQFDRTNSLNGTDEMVIEVLEGDNGSTKCQGNNSNLGNSYDTCIDITNDSEVSMQAQKNAQLNGLENDCNIIEFSHPGSSKVVAAEKPTKPVTKLDKSPTKRSEMISNSERMQINSVESLSTNNDVQILETNEFKKVPYYLENFKCIIKAVLSDPIDGSLFNDEDKMIVEKFSQLSTNAQMLYVRLFQRKNKWLQVSKLKYSEFLNELPVLTSELVSSGFLQDQTVVNDLALILGLMQLPDLKVLMKELNLGASNLQKQQIIEQIMKHSKNQRTIFSFGSNSNCSNNRVLKLAKQNLGLCIKVSSEPCSVFRRAVALFMLTSYSASDDRSISRQQRLLTSLFLNKKNKFPPYNVMRESQIFKDRDDYVMYDQVCEMECEMEKYVDANQYVEAHDVYISCRKLYDELLQQESLSGESIGSVPDILKRFTVGAALVHCMTAGVEILQRLKKYDAAVEQLRLLLDQRTFHQGCRGRWAERLALNLDQHLKKPLEALNVILAGLNDSQIRTGHALDLYLRGKKICTTKSAKPKCKKFLKKLPVVSITEPPKVIIQGSRLPNNKTGCKNYFISQNFDNAAKGDTVLCSVEEYAMNHYKSLGYTNGIHGESSTPVSIFGLLFWDIIYVSLPDVFRSPHQAWPIDLNCDEFYKSRKEAIDHKLEWVRKSSTHELCAEMLDTWFLHQGEVSIVSWDHFADFCHFQSLIECISPSILASLCERYARDYRHNRSGFPDLVVWNQNENIFKVVEVKGPNDRLSTKQIIWIDFLISIGVEAEVCHVSCSNSKRLKKK